MSITNRPHRKRASTDPTVWPEVESAVQWRRWLPVTPKTYRRDDSQPNRFVVVPLASRWFVSALFNVLYKWTRNCPNFTATSRQPKLIHFRQFWVWSFNLFDLGLVFGQSINPYVKNNVLYHITVMQKCYIFIWLRTNLAQLQWFLLYIDTIKSS